MKCFQLEWAIRWTDECEKKGRQRGFFGSLRRCMFACAGSLFALRVLQRMQEQTTFSQEVSPPFCLGMT